MKRLWIATVCGVVALGLSHKAHASELTDEKDMEVEETSAEAEGSIQDAAFLNEKLEQEKMDARLNLAAADKAVKQANQAKAKAEDQIGRVEKEIHQLQAEQAAARLRQKQVQLQRLQAQRRLAQMIQQMRLHRAQLKKTLQHTMLEQKALKATQARIARLQRVQVTQHVQTGAYQADRMASR